MLLAELPHWFVVMTAVSLGLCLGSFLNVVIYRLPRELDLSEPPSQCPACGVPIAPYDNVPVFGWLLLRGRARCCKARISFRYPLVEMLGGLFAWAIVEARIAPRAQELVVGDAVLLFALYLALCLGLLAASAIDLEHMFLPDSITVGGTLIGVCSSMGRPEVTPLSSLLGLTVGYIGVWLPFIWLHEKLRGFPGMGLGDAKLMMLAGAWFGPLGVLFTLFAASLQGTLAAIVVKLSGGSFEDPESVQREREELARAIEAASGEERARLERERDADPLGRSAEETGGGPRIAFGPFLALAIVELALLHDWLNAWSLEYLMIQM